MADFWNHATDIIGAAGKSPLHLIAFALLASMFVAYIFFRESAGWVKLSTYLGLLLFLGVAVIAMAVISVVSSVDKPQYARNDSPTSPYRPAVYTPAPAAGLEALAGEFRGTSRNFSSVGVQNGAIVVRLVSVSPEGVARMQISESNGLQGDCNLDAVILADGAMTATGLCRDSIGFYDARIVGNFLDYNHVQGDFFVNPRPGTNSVPQRERFVAGR